MKILFLDVDGVINSKETVMANPAGTPIGINPYLAFLVGKIVLDTDCKIVVSSSWKNLPDGMKKIEAMFPPGTVIDKTPNLSNMRGDEVNLWFTSERHGAKFIFDKYAILDDNDDFYDDQPLFKTTWEKGITEEIAKQVTDYLNEK